MSKLTKEQIAEYLDNGGLFCPHCESGGDLEYGSTAIDCGMAMNVSCKECGEKWTDRYELVGVLESEAATPPEPEPSKPVPMTPWEFKGRMELTFGLNGDTESGHIMADALLCEVLISLGYQDGVEIFQKAGKWYA